MRARRASFAGFPFVRFAQTIRVDQDTHQGPLVLGRPRRSLYIDIIHIYFYIIYSIYIYKDEPYIIGDIRSTKTKRQMDEKGEKKSEIRL